MRVSETTSLQFYLTSYRECNNCIHTFWQILMSAPLSISSWTTAVWPSQEADQTGVTPFCREHTTEHWTISVRSPPHSSNIHKSIVYTSHYRLTVKTSHILLTIEHDMFSKPCQEWRLQPQPWATDVQHQHDLCERLTVEQCILPASGGDTETSGAAVNELSQKWDYTFTSRDPHILSSGVDIDRSGEESLNCLHISSLSSIVELCSSLGIETRIIRSVSYKENCVRDKPTSKSSALRLPL